VIGFKLGGMNLPTHFQMLALYSHFASERLFAACAQLDDAELRKPRAGSFGSIHGLLNRIPYDDFSARGMQSSIQSPDAPSSAVHAMLSQTPVAPPSLDLHRIVNP
jgi:hypothetical protein